MIATHPDASRDLMSCSQVENRTPVKHADCAYGSSRRCTSTHESGAVILPNLVGVAYTWVMRGLKGPTPAGRVDLFEAQYHGYRYSQLHAARLRLRAAYGPVAARKTAQITTILAITSPANGSTAERIDALVVASTGGE
jgi:hypothetical protein